mgnify:CR=1 FL=1
MSLYLCYCILYEIRASRELKDEENIIWLVLAVTLSLLHHLGWQHPFVNVSKYFDVEKKKNCKVIGEIHALSVCFYGYH